MKTNHEQITNTPPKAKRKTERGNALIYVLIAVTLFAALSFTLSRQSDTDEADDLTDERATFYATQLIGYATQTKSVIDQMLFSGSDIDDLAFMLPTNPGFNAGSHIHKVFHPEGGGLGRATIPAAAVGSALTTPVPGWYLGRFNNIEWTTTAGNEVILVAYQISRQVCEQINEAINGSANIPVMNGPGARSIRSTMIHTFFHGTGNAELTTDAGDDCPECDRVTSLCVENAEQSAYGFFTVIADQ